MYRQSIIYCYQSDVTEFDTQAKIRDRQDIQLPLTAVATRNQHNFTARPMTEEVTVIIFTPLSFARWRALGRG